MYKKELIQILRDTADRVEADPNIYEWCDSTKCNCGQVVQTALNINSEELLKLTETTTDTWAYLSCNSTGLPLDFVIQKLFDLGLTTADIIELEDLSNPLVLDKLNIIDKRFSFSSRKNFINYIRAWADMIEIQYLDQNVSNKAKSVQTVSI